MSGYYLDQKMKECVGVVEEETLTLCDTIPIHVGKRNEHSPPALCIQYKNDEMIRYDIYEEDLDEVDVDWIKDTLNAIDGNWREKYATKIPEESVIVKDVFLVTPSRIMEHRNGSKPMTLQELMSYRSICTKVPLRPRKKITKIKKN